MNSSVTATERLKFTNSEGSSFTVMKDIMSGWSTLKTPMFAPLLVPPCFIASVAALKTLMKETGPLASPPVEPTMSFKGLNRLKEKPVPPPDWWIMAVFFTESNMEFMESSTGSTKHAASCWRRLPAFIRVGGIWKEFKSRHKREKPFFGLFYVRVFSVKSFRLRDIGCHPSKHPFGCFNDPARSVFFKVPFLKNRQGI